ncbi:MAG: serine/threonine protein kinase [bacterium]|nr:serine/threonine protein kinase [bacterium]
MDEERRNPVEALAEEFIARTRCGESPSIEEYVRRHPEHAAEIEALFPAALLVERMKTGAAWPSSPAAPTRPPMPAIKRLGDYHIVRELGCGGMGMVYEAEQETLHRRVALKVLLPWAVGSAGRVERFRREAQAAANLHHTNIVQVFGVGEDDGFHYYVMQLIDGAGLDTHLANHEAPFAPCEAARIGLQVASGLAHAHEQGVLHRDVKPANVLLDSDGTAWIADFGLAKVLQDPQSLTEAGDVIGTIRYMPPERFEGRSDASGDIYGLGLLLYELLTGRPAYGDRDRGSLLRAVREGSVPSPRLLASDIPRDLETIVLKASARERSARYGSAAELAEDLENFLADRPIQARRASVFERGWRWCRRNRAVASLTGVAALAVLLAAAAGWTGYLMTQNALERESRERELAQAATGRAELNEHMSLDALETIFQSLVRRDDLPPAPGPGAPSAPGSRVEADVIRSVLDFYDRFAAANETNPRLRHEAAKVLRHAANLHARMGDTTAAQATFARAITALEALHREQPDDPEPLHDLIRALGDASMWASHAGASEDALRHAERAAALCATLRVAGDDPRSAGLTATVRCRLAVALAAAGDETRAREAIGAVRATWQSLARGPGAPPGLEVDLARGYMALAEGLLATARHEQALSDLDVALGILKTLGSSEDGSAPPPPVLARIEQRRARALRALGREDEARQAEKAADDARGARPGRGPGPRRPR